MNALKMLAAVAAFFAASAQADVIDFNELSHGHYYQGHQAIESDGFVFTGNKGIKDELGVWGHNHAYQADPGHASVFINYGRDRINMTRADGQAFRFSSIDLGDVYNRGVSSTFRFFFNYITGGFGTEDVTLDRAAGLQTFTFHQSAVSSVSWENIAGDNGWGQFDNVSVGVAQPVPEPETYALMLVGLGAVAWSVRRRRKEQQN